MFNLSEVVMTDIQKCFLAFIRTVRVQYQHEYCNLWMRIDYCLVILCNQMELQYSVQVQYCIAHVRNTV
jgi:hypothetical protein